MKRKLFTTAIFLCCVIVCFASITDLTGKWKGTIKAPDGTEIPISYNFKVDGDKLSGIAQSQGEDLIIENGKINGPDFTFSVTNEEGSVIPHSGKYYTDSVSMNIESHGLKFHSTLTRDDK